MRCVLDTNVVVAAMRSPRGASAGLLRAARGGLLFPIGTVALALEYEATCRDPKHIQASGLSLSQVDVYLNAVIAMMEPVEPIISGGRSFAILAMSWCWRRR